MVKEIKMWIFDILLYLILCVLAPLFVLSHLIELPLSNSSGASGDPTQGAPRRSTLLSTEEDLLKSPHHTINNLFDLLSYGAKTYNSKALFGSRQVLDVVKETKIIKKVVGGKETSEAKEWSYFVLSEFKWINYSQVLSKAKCIGSGLISLGLSKGDNVTIFHSTSPEWMLFSYGCYSQSLTITTAYDSLGVDALSYSLNEAQVSTIFTQSDLLPIIKGLHTSVPTLKIVIYSGKSPVNLAEMQLEVPHLKFISLNQVEQEGNEKPLDLNLPESKDLACIMYTSGSTGNPKGVMITHGSMIAAVAGANRTLDACPGLINGKDDTYLGYLPLAHVLEFLIENVCVFKGIAIGYGSPRTLTDSSVRNCKGDIKECKPTLMAGVPAVWETIRKGIQSQLRQASFLKQQIFRIAFELKKCLVKLKLPTFFIDTSIFQKISDGTGGRLRGAVSGGAPVAEETQEFLSMVLCPVIQGYGMTESCGMMTCQTTQQIGICANVGAPSPACEIKLVACNNYNPNPTDKNQVPQGELWVRGNIVMQGYYKQPTITSEAITEDGWLKSGDIAEWRPDGSLKIIDRKKNLVKLSNGEYVALEKLEAQYKTSRFVLNLLIHADSLEAHIIGLIVVDPKEISILQNSLGLDSDNITHPDIIKQISNDFLQCAKKANFNGAEVLKHFSIVQDEWTAGNGDFR